MFALDRTFEQRRQLLLVLHAALLVVSGVAAILVSRRADWEPVGLVLVLLGFAIVGELLTLGGPSSHFTISPAGYVLAATLLGPAPAVAMAVAAELIHSAQQRRALLPLVANLAISASLPLVIGLLARAAVSSGDLSKGSAEFALLVVLLYVLHAGLSSLLVVGATGFLDAIPLLPRLRADALPVYPVELMAGLFTGGVAYLYGRIGLRAMPFLAFALGLFLYLMRELLKSRQRADRLELLQVDLRERAERIAALAASRGRLVAQALDAEDRERRRLAESLHDEAIQTLLFARQELDEARTGDARAVDRAHDAIAQTVESLRGAIFNLHPAVLDHAGLAAALAAVAEQQARLGKMRFDVNVTPAVGADEHLLFSLARELMVNAAKHSRASVVVVRIGPVDDGVELLVADDGRGFDPARREVAVREGHIGLASTAERVEALGGRFELDTAVGRGTRTRIVLPPPTPGDAGPGSAEREEREERAAALEAPLEAERA